MDNQKVWLQINKLHRELKLLGYSMLGEDVHENIENARKEIKVALDKMTKKIEKN